MKKEKIPIASIIIPTFNSWYFLKKCLMSINKNTKIPHEIIVIEGGSKDNTFKKLKQHFGKQKNLKIIDVGADIGPPAKKNIGVKIAKGKYLVFLDSDIIVCRNFLKKTITFLEKNKDIAGGQIKMLRIDKRKYFDSAGEKITPLGFLAERAQGAKDTGQFDSVENIFSAKIGAGIFRKKSYLSVGGFDNSLYMYWEEPDLCWRIWKSGYRIVFLPKNKVWHASSSKKVSKEQLSKITYLGCRNQIITFFKNSPNRSLLPRVIIIYASWILLSTFFLIKFDFDRSKAVWKALFDSIRLLPATKQKREKLIKMLGKKHFNNDNDWLNSITHQRGICWYLGKFWAYILNRPF